MAGRRPSQNANASGTAVNASAKLCTVSASSATDPEVSATAAWSRPVTSRATKLSFRARSPRLLDSSAESTESEAAMAVRTEHRPQHAVPARRMPVPVAVRTVAELFGRGVAVGVRVRHNIKRRRMNTYSFNPP